MEMILAGCSKPYQRTPLILLMSSPSLTPHAISCLSRHRIGLFFTTLESPAKCVKLHRRGCAANIFYVRSRWRNRREGMLSHQETPVHEIGGLYVKRLRVNGTQRQTDRA